MAAATGCTGLPNDCSLRGAIIKANTTAGTDTISVPAGTYTLTIAGRSEEAAARGDLDLTESVIIQGAGATNTIIQAGTSSPVSPSTCADCVDRVFHMVSNTVTAEFNGLTIRHGSEPDGGAAIWNAGTAKLFNSTVTANDAGNGSGGGINNDSRTLEITNSTISGSFSAFRGGGIYNIGGTVTITNSTLSGNSAGSGGGILNFATAIINNSTLANNFANSGGGIFNGGPLTLKNSIVANNPSSGNCVNSGGTFTALGKNFDTDGTVPGSMQVSAAQLNLGPLQNNGGPTQTHALLPGSVAIDAVTDCTTADFGHTLVTTDQRDAPRPFDGDGNGSSLCDVGAFEFGSPTMIILVSFTATAYDNAVLLEWQTGFETDNLGFNLYREAGGKRAAVNPQLIAGSALRASSVSLTGTGYQWWDNSIDKSAAYWLEDLDLNGGSTWHGPVYAKATRRCD